MIESSTSGITLRCSTLRRLLQFWLLLLLPLGLGMASARAQTELVLVGSGSSVPAPLYKRWTQEYSKRNSKIQMRYLPVGTSEGIRQIAHGAGDFGAGEAPLTEGERKEGGLTELPVVLIAIVPIYNLPDVRQELRLSGDTRRRDDFHSLQTGVRAVGHWPAAARGRNRVCHVYNRA